MTTLYPNPHHAVKFNWFCHECKHPSPRNKGSLRMAPDTSLQSFVGASSASMALGAIPTSPRTPRDTTLEEELVDPDAKLVLSDFTQSIPNMLVIWGN